MRRILRWLAYGLVAIVGLLLIFGAWVWVASYRVMNKAYAATSEQLASPSPEQLADAARQARLLGCPSCHGDDLRGNKMIDEPGVATVWAPNLTLIAARASDQQIAAGIRQGIGVDGRPLWIMPSGVFSRLSDSEVAALIAYIRALPRGGELTPPVSVGPLGRLGIARGDVLPAPATIEEFRIRQPYDLGQEYAAGRRIASLICAECHAPDLSGGGTDPEMRPPGLSIVGAYRFDQFRTLMRTGRPPSGRDLGLMAEAAREDFSRFTEQEIAQLYHYLKARSERVQDAPLETP